MSHSGLTLAMCEEPPGLYTFPFPVAERAWYIAVDLLYAMCEHYST